MGHLRDRMDADLRLAGRSESTRRHYLSCARLFVKHFMRPAETMGQAEVRQFLLHLADEAKVSVGRYLQYLGALKFLYGVTLGRPEVVAGIARDHQVLLTELRQSETNGLEQLFFSLTTKTDPAEEAAA